MPGTLRLSRGHLRYLAAMERGGIPVIIFMTILPIFINIAWTIIYFKERTDDVFLYGPCKPNSTAKFVTPFFITNRGDKLWGAQVVFAILTVFVWAPYRYLRPMASRYVLRNSLLFLVDFVTLMPFLLSLVFTPAYVSYVPTFLRVWVVKYEALSLFPPQQKIRYLIVYLAMDIISITLSVIGAFEWSMNNFPFSPINVSGMQDYDEAPVYPCLDFFDSFYWFLVTFSTVGYGDVVPTNIVSRMLVLFFIMLFLFLLPEFVNKASAILSSYSDLKDARFDNAKKRDFLVIDGPFGYAEALRAITVLQPKYFTEEFTVSFIVVVSEEKDNLSELVVLRDAHIEDYTRLILLDGCLEAPEVIERSGAEKAKTIILLPHPTPHISHPTAHRHHKVSLRESTEQTRDYYTKRDFDIIRRLWANQIALPLVPTRILLMHRSNLNLIDSRPLPSESGRLAALHPEYGNRLCSCSTVDAFCADYFEQRVAAASTLVPAFGTLLVMMVLGGSCDHKSLEEYEAEATTLAAIDRVYETAPSLMLQGSGFTINDSIAKSIRSIVTRARSLRPEDDEQYIKSYRNTLIAIRFNSSAPMQLGYIRRYAFEARILVLGFVAHRHWCAHADFKSNRLVTAHSCMAEPGDGLICFGTTHHIDILRRSAFWQRKRAADSSFGMQQKSSTQFSPDAVVVDRKTSLAMLREGEHDHVQESSRYEVGGFRPLDEVHIRDARGPDASEEEDVANSGSSSHPDDAMDSDAESIPSSQTQDGSLYRGISLRERLEDHIIVNSACHDDYVFFVRKLRERKLGSDRMRPILLFDSRPPNKFKWSEIAVFENVYFLQGRPFVIDDLRRAGFDRAHSLVLMTDLRVNFETEYRHSTPPCDRDHLIAEKVASRLKKEFGCKTRIITHLAREELCQFISLSTSRTIDFQIKEDEEVSNEYAKKRKAFSTLAKLVGDAWAPSLHSAFIAGECWSPSCFPLLFFSTECKGPWMASMLESFIESAGEKGGLQLLEVPPECDTYESAVLHFLSLRLGLVMGIYRNYVGVIDAYQSDTFRGCILFPDNHVLVSAALDRLYVLTAAEPEELV